MSPLLSVRNLKVVFDTEYGQVVAVNGVSFQIDHGEILAVVGESGSGKSVTALSILRLIQEPQGRIVEGEILLEGRNLLELSPKELRKVRGNQISMIFQEPMTSLNPVYRIGTQIMEPLILHQGQSHAQAREKAAHLLELVGISKPVSFLANYPHQLSGGMRQRVMIAMALACNPRLLIADEPTTALDVTIQAQIFDLLRRLQEELEMAVILITHDLGVVAEFAHRVIVMYAGRMVEEAPIDVLFENSMHPYTEGLIRSIPQVDEDRERLYSIDGVVPSPFDMPAGCAFHPRCSLVVPPCTHGFPDLERHGPSHRVACIRHREDRTRSVTTSPTG
ncbi:MAG: ABC transporter ATP-binding protein [Desulfarculaceae bacterium]